MVQKFQQFCLILSYMINNYLSLTRAQLITIRIIKVFQGIKKKLITKFIYLSHEDQLQVSNSIS